MKSINDFNSSDLKINCKRKPCNIDNKNKNK